jgi:hypothetical protein
MSTCLTARARALRLAAVCTWLTVQATIMPAIEGTGVAASRLAAVPRVILTMTETDGSGVVGSAVLSRNGNETVIVITVTRTEIAPEFPYTAHLHRGKTCEQQEMADTIDLVDVVGTGRSESTVHYDLDVILDGGWLVNVHEDPDHIKTDLACGLVPPTYSGEDVGLQTMKEQVFVRPPEGEEVSLPLWGLRAVGNDDTISVDAGGEAWLRFLDYLLIRIFQTSELGPCLDPDQSVRQASVTYCPDVVAGAPEDRRVTLLSGTIDVQTRIAIDLRTGSGTIIDVTGTHFIVHYDGRRALTWIIATEGTVAVTSAGQTVLLDAGFQTQVVGNDPPRPSQPATRPDLESRYPGVFPLLQDATNGALREEDVLGEKGPVTPSPTAPLPFDQSPGPTETAPPAIDQPPSAPTIAAEVSPDGNEVTLTWTESSDDYGVVGYEVYRNDFFLTSTDAGETAYTDTLLGLGDGEYTYYVRAIDSNGQPSGRSNEVTVHHTKCTAVSSNGIAWDTVGQESVAIEAKEFEMGAAVQGQPELVYADLVSEINRQPAC